MKKIIGSLVLFIMGWKMDKSLDLSKIDKCVMVAAPHTSNWDFVLAVSSFWKMGIPMRLFIKDDWTKPWYGFFIKWMGGIGVDRSARKNMVQHAAKLITESDRLYMLNTPEGTRSWSEKWKKGFYYIALEAEVPILLAYGDYKNKIIGFKKMIDPAGKSLEEVFTEIEDFYRDIPAKFPENYNPKIF